MAPTFRSDSTRPTTEDAAASHALPPGDRGAGTAGTVPDVQARTVVGVFDTLDAADGAADALHAAGYPLDQLSVAHAPEGTPPSVGAEVTRAAEGTAAGAAAGALLGGALGLTAVALTGGGALLVAGPILAALGGGAVGGLTGSFVGLGIPTDHAERYDKAVRAGGALVAINVPDDDDAHAAAEMLRGQGARDVEDFTPTL